MAKSLSDKVFDARVKAGKTNVAFDASDTVRRNAKAAKVELTIPEERRAAKLLRGRMQTDRSRTAARGMAIEKTQAKKQAAKRLAAATGNAPATKKKAAAKPTTKKTGKK